MTVDTLYFHDLQPAPEGSYLVTIPPELQDAWAARIEARLHAFHMDLPEPAGPAVDVVAFLVRGPAWSDRFGIMVRLEDLTGTPEDNVESIRRTMPNEWEVLARFATM